MTAWLAINASATVTNLVWYRLGDNDPGASSGAVVNSSAVDLMGVRNLSRLGSPVYTNLVSPTAGKIGSSLAVQFNGVDQAYSSSVFTTVQNNFGIEAWVLLVASAQGTYYIAHNGNVTANGWGLFATIGQFGVAGYGGEFGGGTQVGFGAHGSAGSWRHVALVRDNGVSTFYFNGVASGSTSGATPALPSGAFATAAAPGQPGFFPGVIDEVRVFTFAPGQFSPNDLLVNQELVATLSATDLTTNGATLNGTASSFGFPTIAWFEWGATTNLGNVTTTQDLGSQAVNTNFSENLPGLSFGVRYYFRAVVTNKLGIAKGTTRSFDVGTFLETLPATDLTVVSATLNGNVDPNGFDTSTWFEWGMTTNYGVVTTPQALGSGVVEVNFNETLTNLVPNLTYHFRAVASNSVGILFGADRSFVPVSAFTFEQLLRASNPGDLDRFGSSVALSDNGLLVVGAPQERSNATGINGNEGNDDSPFSGAVYGFVRNGTNWTKQVYLKASNAEEFDEFGASVAISGETVVVGATEEASSATGVNGNQADNSAVRAGAAYVFVRNGASWAQQAYLKASNTEAEDRFARAVAISGDTIVVAAPNEASNATGVNGNQADNTAVSAGAVYVFVRNGTNWSQQAYLKASNAERNDFFGGSVAISGDTIVVGAEFEDSSTTGINGNQTDNSATNAGAAYVFVRSGTNWTQQAYLKASNTDMEDRFGSSVAISGDTIVVGAKFEASSATGVNGNQADNSDPGSGAAYVFLRSGSQWSQDAYLKASGPAGDFGARVAMSKQTVVIGNQVFQHSADAWILLDLPPGEVGAGFDSPITIAGDLLAVGAPWLDYLVPPFEIEVYSEAGAVQVYSRPPFHALLEVKQINETIPNGAPVVFLAAEQHTVSQRFDISNQGNITLFVASITLDGSDPAAFEVVENPATAIAPGGSSSFTVRFAPADTNPKAAALHLASTDDNNPFNLQLSGLTLFFGMDTDGDGLNDAAEGLLAPLGFDFQVSQPDLVNTLFSNLDAVIPNLNAAGFFAQSQLQALNVEAPLLAKDSNSGLFTLTIGVEKAPQLTNFFPFPMTAPQTMINAEGKLEFQFSAPDDAAFFRLESH